MFEISPRLTMLVGPPGSGKSTMAKQIVAENYGMVYVNQDSQGRFEHMDVFLNALYDGKDVLVDRMNFNKVQREKYLGIARSKGYRIEIHVLHQPYEVCLDRALKRKDHETIKDEENALQAIGFFFRTYERVEDCEADKVIRHYPEGPKPPALICDLDGTLCNIEHRRHHVRPEPGSGKKKNWMAFMEGIPNDTIHGWCQDILTYMADKYEIVLCSGRGEEERAATEEWLKRHQVYYNALFMRQAKDSRKDSIVKENILDFEILTRCTPVFFIDDRQQVVDMWRKRGYVCLQCDPGDF